MCVWLCYFLVRYPIYRIPMGPTLQNLDASFLTFHYLSTHSRSISLCLSFTIMRHKPMLLCYIMYLVELILSFILRMVQVSCSILLLAMGKYAVLMHLQRSLYLFSALLPISWEVQFWLPMVPKNGSEQALCYKLLTIGCTVYKSIFLISSFLCHITHSGGNKGTLIFCNRSFE